MKIYFAGTVGIYQREKVLLNMINTRLLSFYEIHYDKNDQHFQRRSFELIKKK